MKSTEPSIPPDRRKGRPTVVQVLPALETGGVEQGTVDVAAALVKAGWRAVVASAGGAMVPALREAGAEHVTLPLAAKNPVTLLANAGRLARLLRDTGADLVHARSRAPAWSALLAARRTGTPLVTTYHGTYNRAPRFLKDPYNGVMGRGERVIAISGFIAAHVRAVHGVPATRLRTVPRGIDTAAFDPQAITPGRLERVADDWPVGPRTPVVLLPGRLTRWKGQMVLVEAMARLRHPDAVAVLAGGAQGRDAYVAELAERIAALGLDGRVVVDTACRDLPAAYARSAVAVSASTDPEAFGRVPVEAQAMERPVIATNHGGAAETVADGATGWLVPPGDADALAAALDHALALDAGARATLGRAGRDRVLLRYTREAMTAAVLEVYSELLPRDATAEAA